MIKLGRVSISIFFLILIVCAEEYDRKGIFFGASVTPELSYQRISTSISSSTLSNSGSSGSFAKTLGALRTGVQLDFSRNGKNIQIIQTAFSWDFPTARFLGAISSGYSFVHYFSICAPSLALGYEVNYSFRLNGFNDNYLFPGTQFGFKFGYEIKKNITCWLGYLLSIEDYTYHFNSTIIDPNDLSNTIRELGEVKVNEFVLANRFQISLSYLFY